MSRSWVGRHYEALHVETRLLPGVEEDVQLLLVLAARLLPEHGIEALAARGEEAAAILGEAGLGHELLAAARIVRVLGERPVQVGEVGDVRADEGLGDGGLAIEHAIAQQLLVHRVGDGAPYAQVRHGRGLHELRAVLHLNVAQQAEGLQHYALLVGVPLPLHDLGVLEADGAVGRHVDRFGEDAGEGGVLVRHEAYLEAIDLRLPEHMPLEGRGLHERAGLPLLELVGSEPDVLVRPVRKIGEAIRRLRLERLCQDVAG